LFLTAQPCCVAVPTAHSPEPLFVKNKQRQLEVTSVALPVPEHYRLFRQKMMQRRASKVYHAMQCHTPPQHAVPCHVSLALLCLACCTLLSSSVTVWYVQPQPNPFAVQSGGGSTGTDAAAQRKLSRQMEDPATRRRSQQAVRPPAAAYTSLWHTRGACKHAICLAHCMHAFAPPYTHCPLAGAATGRAKGRRPARRVQQAVLS